MIYKRITEYTVCALPHTHPDHHRYKLTVRLESDGWWVVSGAGTPRHLSRDLESALRHAEQAAPGVTVDDVKASDARWQVTGRA